MLCELFKRCLNASYIHTDCGGDYAIEVDGDTLYLLFECSDGAEDWRSNFNFPARAYKNGSDKWFCHRGFLKVWKAMRDDIEEKVRKELNADSSIEYIVCVGYSHGGAISLFATEDIQYLYGESHKVTGYGFGSPRVLWGIVPKAVRNRLRAFKVIRNVPDLVTHVPPVLFGFTHGGEVVKVGRFGKYTLVGAHYPDAYINELTTTKGETS